MRKLCTGCTIVALDVLDQRGVEGYIASFFKAAGADARARADRRHPQLLRGQPQAHEGHEHATRARGASSTAVPKANKRAKFWYTETGGLTRQGTAFPCNDARAADRTQYMFTLAKRYERYIQRLYTYNWTPSADCEDPLRRRPRRTSTAPLRPAYNVFKSNLRSFRR